jgi:hypothetical protein
VDGNGIVLISGGSSLENMVSGLIRDHSAEEVNIRDMVSETLASTAAVIWQL